MWCFVSEPNGIIHEIFLPSNAIGQDCFDKVCEKLKLAEKDYFGLKYNGGKGSKLWLNLRNPMATQLTGKPPYRLYFLVKFFVRPQELQQEITRHQYYLTLKSYIHDSKLDLSALQTKTVARICALIAQIECGDNSPERNSRYCSYLPSDICNLYSNTSDLQKDSAAEHGKLVNSSASEVKVEFLNNLCNIPGYGVELFRAKMNDGKEMKKVEICVAADGVRAYSVERDFDLKQRKDVVRKILEKRISFVDVSTVSYNSRSFTVVHGASGGPQLQRDTYKLKNEVEAVSLFRTFTEFHTFYQCNTVKRSVVDQCTRTFFGRVLSVFLSESEVGKTYLFDVQHTRRQAYSKSWNELNSGRFMVTSGQSTTERVDASNVAEYRPVQSPLSMRKSYSLKRRDDQVAPRRAENQLAFVERENMEGLSQAELKKVVRNLQEARVCQICMDTEVATAFCPCGHVVCCVECSVMCKECPLCRSQITYAQRVFFPCE